MKLTLSIQVGKAKSTRFGYNTSQTLWRQGIVQSQWWSWFHFSKHDKTKENVIPQAFKQSDTDSNFNNGMWTLLDTKLLFMLEKKKTHLEFVMLNKLQARSNLYWSGDRCEKCDWERFILNSFLTCDESSWTCVNISTSSSVTCSLETATKPGSCFTLNSPSQPVTVTKHYSLLQSLYSLLQSPNRQSQSPNMLVQSPNRLSQ